MVKAPASTNPVNDKVQSETASVSVVVPSYNHAPFIAQTLRSIFKQTRKPLELIVIDDGSSDGSPQVIERVLQQCPFACELIVRPNRGLCATLNEGLARSRGSFFAYLGSDDLWLPEFLKARVELLEGRAHAVLAYGSAYSIDEENRIIDCTTDWARYVDGNVQKMLLGGLAPLSPTVLYRRNVLERHWWNEAARLEDYELYLRLSAEGEFAFDPRILSAWRQHSYNTSRNVAFMMQERLDAQRRVAPALGLTAEMSQDFQALIRFRGAEEFMRGGQKLRAMKLMSQSLRGLPSAASAVKMLTKLLIPHRIFLWRRNRIRRQAMKHYGSIQI